MDLKPVDSYAERSLSVATGNTEDVPHVARKLQILREVDTRHASDTAISEDAPRSARALRRWDERKEPEFAATGGDAEDGSHQARKLQKWKATKRYKALEKWKKQKKWQKNKNWQQTKKWRSIEKWQTNR